MVAVSSVVPPLQLNLEKMAERYFHQKPMFVGPGVKSRSFIIAGASRC